MSVQAPLTDANSLIFGYANGFHDPALALIQGDYIFAESFERSSQAKRSIGSPLLTYAAQPIARQLDKLLFDHGGAADVVLRTSWHFRKRDLLMALGGLIIDPRRVRRLLAGEGAQLWTLRSLRIFQMQLEDLIRDARVFGSPVEVKVRKTQHHLVHAAAAVYTSSFEECVVMIVDGTAETTSTSLYRFKDNRFELLASSPSQHSLGLLYSRITQYCGFSALWGEEWKVMGLAAYGTRNESVYRFFADRVRVDGLQVRMRFTELCFGELERLAGGFRRNNDPDILRSAELAHTFQQFFTDTVVALARNLDRLGYSKNLAYGGGCALNSSANGRILTSTGFEKLHIPSAPADDGNSLGAALYEKYFVRGHKRAPLIASPYLGSELDDERIREQLVNSGYSFVEFPDEGSLVDHVADQLSSGHIVAWVQGRAEFGPRALGHRSILADPRTVEMRDKVNRLIKRREDFRPLAPSVLDEHADEFFEDYQESPYMERTLFLRKTHAPRVAGIAHHDGSARLQTVTPESCPLYHKLISAFFARTGVPMVLNTSLNVMGKPIVHSMDDALTVFSGTQIDVLVANRFVATKRGPACAA